MLLRNGLKYWFRYCAALVFVVLSIVAVTGDASAATYDFSNLGVASGGFKPQGNRFLVSELFAQEDSSAPAAIYYNDSGLDVSGITIKADSVNLISFDLTNMDFIYYTGETITSITVTGTKTDNSTVTATVTPGLGAAGAHFTLTGKGANLTNFTNLKQLQFRIIMADQNVACVDFASITVVNEVHEVITTPTIQASAMQAYKTADTEVALNWTKGNGNSRLVFAKQGVTSGVPTLVDGTTYTPNADFSAAADIGAGWKCVYSGNADYAMVSGLTATTQYRFVVFEYNGYSSAEKYLQTTPAALNQATLGSFGTWTSGDISTLNAENFWTWTDAERDSSGNSYVANQYSDTTGQMQVQKWNGTAWSTLTSFTPATAGYGSFGDGSSMAVTGTDQLRLAIYGVNGASTSWGIVEAKYNGAAWSYQNLETSSTVNQLYSTPLISVDGSGNSHILYEFYNAAASPQVQYIKLASWNGSAWSYQTLSTISNPNSYNEVKKTYLLLNDASNRQHVFYFRQTSAAATDLHYWTNSSGSWVDTTIFTGNTDAPYRLSGAFDSSGKLHLSYTNNTLLGKVVMHMTNKSGSWVTQPLMAPGLGWDKGYTALDLRINGSGDMVIPLRLTSATDNAFKVLLKQGSNPWYVSTLSPAAADYEDASNSYAITGATFGNDGKVMLAYANGLSSRPRKLMYSLVALGGNTAPAFVGATTTLTVNQNASATDIKGLLHVSDSDPSQTETWSQSAAPSHGTLSFSSATATSGTVDITPGGTITYTPTAGYSGSDSFTVQVGDGTVTATRTITVTVVPPPPTVTGISPASGPTAGGTSVTITGTNLTGATAVKFGAAAATGYTVNSATQITATSPAGSVGTVDITVVTAGGTSATSASDQFSYVTAPTVTTQAASAITATSATGNGNITATGGANATNRGVLYWNFNNADQVMGDGGVTNVAEIGNFGTGAFIAAITPLAVNTQYNARAYAISPNGTGYGARVAFWTLANVPAAPTVTNSTATTLDVAVNVNGNPVITVFCIQETSTGNYVQADGTLNVGAVWQSAAIWGTKTVTGLTTGSAYTFQVKARNGGAAETAYGATSSGVPVAAPTVTSQAASAITATAATGNGNITATGGANTSTRGAIFYVYTNTDKVIGDAGVTNVAENGNFGTGAFIAALTPLAVNTQYNARAYATSPNGTGYGARVAFWTLANVPAAPTVTNPTATTLDVAVNVNGNPAITVFCIQETSTGNYVQADGTLNVGAVWQSAAIWGTKTVTGLTTGSAYTFQVKARNGGAAETAYGATSSGVPVAAPTVTSQAASAITATAATGNGNITATGGANTSTRGAIFYVYTNTDKVIGDAGVTNVAENGNFGTGAFIAALTPLAVNTQYNARAYAISPNGTGYGARVAFWTLANLPSAPTITNASLTTLDVAVNANSNPAATLFCIQETSTGNYVQADGTLNAGAVWQSAAIWGTKTVTGLSAGSTYTFQVKARNGGATETAYGATSSGVPVAVPTVTSQAASAITASAATGNGNITATGGANATARGVIYYLYTNTDKLIGDGGVTNVSTAGSFSTGAFSASLTGLTANTRYNARAYASSIGGTGYGDRDVFWTLANIPLAPTVDTPTATTLNVTVNVNGNPAGTEFCIQETSTGNYVQAGGALAVGQVWQTAATWGTKTVSGLTTGTTYTFQVTARNGGASASSNSGTASLSTLVDKVRGIVIDSAAPLKLYAGVDGAGVYRSTDGGASWLPPTDPANKRVMALAINPANHNTLFAAAYGGGIISSSDSGDHWVACGNGGLGSLNALSLAIDPAGMLYAGTEAGIFTSSDCAAWSAVNNGLSVDALKPPVAIAVDPANAARLYAGLDGAGVFRTVDSGLNWSAATTQPTNLNIKALVITPGASAKLFVASYGGGLFTSSDSGATWAACANTGLTNLNLVSLAIDASGKLYAGSEAGVFVSADGCATWTAMNGGLP